VPVFFISIGLEINMREFNPESLFLLLTIVVIGVVGKIFGSGLGALLGGFSKLESLQLGAGMVSRGEVGLIVAAIGLQEGYVKSAEFSAVIGMVIITTLITPPLLRTLFAKKQQPGQSESDTHPHHSEEVVDVHDHARSG
jgi:Kef-type K+ transport system membrane component KefB